MARAIGKIGGAILALVTVGAAMVAHGQGLPAQAPNADDSRRAMVEARAQADLAAARAKALEAAAARSTANADQLAQGAAALAARVQEEEARVAAEDAEIGLIERQRAGLRAGVAAREAPLIRLTAALQLLARRPLAATLLRPGSLADTVHLRAVLATLLPQIRARTQALRAQIARGQRLQAEAHAASHNLRGEQAALEGRRSALARAEARERLAARTNASAADQAAERAKALAAQSRDLAGLVQRLDGEHALADQLAALPGPVLRPAAGAPPAGGLVVPPAIPEIARPTPYQLPVAGRLVSGFGNGASGITMAPLAGAQVVAPAAGRVGFAGPYRGYGVVVIITHPGGWTSVVTGLAEGVVSAGDQLIAGAPLGTAGPGHPIVGVELRHAGVPTDPLDQSTGH